MQIVTLLCFALIIYTEAQWTPDPTCPYPSDVPHRYPYYGNCSVYWECFEGTKYTMECPEGLEFHAKLEQCDTPSIADCDHLAPTTEWTTASSSGSTKDGATSSSAPHPDCPTDTENITFFPVEGDCTKYWECFAGNIYLQECPKGLWWHQEFSDCDYPGDYCNDDINPTSTSPRDPTTSSLPPQPECSSTSDETTYYPVEGDCTKFWECSEGQLSQYTCPGGLWWNPKITSCDRPGGSSSSGTTSETTTDSTSSATTASTSDGSTSSISSSSGPTSNPICGSGDDVTYLPYPGDCSKYYECWDGILYVVYCPDGEWWNQAKEECGPDEDVCESHR